MNKADTKLAANLAAGEAVAYGNMSALLAERASQAFLRNEEAMARELRELSQAFAGEAKRKREEQRKHNAALGERADNG